MFHVGLDIHSRRIAVCVLGETGQVDRRAQVRTIDEMYAFTADEVLRSLVAVSIPVQDLAATRPTRESAIRNAGI